MAQATHAYTTSKFHNLSNEALADAIGQADALLKGAEAECKALKEEFKSRGLLTVAGERFTITRSDRHNAPGFGKPALSNSRQRPPERPVAEPIESDGRLSDEYAGPGLFVSRAGM